VLPFLFSASAVAAALLPNTPDGSRGIVKVQPTRAEAAYSRIPRTGVGGSLRSNLPGQKPPHFPNTPMGVGEELAQLLCEKSPTSKAAVVAFV
jgi:hypothetical protein